MNWKKEIKTIEKETDKDLLRSLSVFARDVI